MVRKDMPPIRIPSAKNDDQPVTRKSLYLVRDELKSEIRSHSAKTDSLSLKVDSINSKVDSLDSKIDSLELKIDSLDSRIDSLDSRIDSLDSRIDSLDLKIDWIGSKIDSRFDDIKADFHYLKLLSENDEANRRSVLEGHQLLWQRLQQNEKK
jgi:peptidoglycan hydrolase CwlO-like protein